MRTVNKSIWNCCPMCAKAQNSESQKHKGIWHSYSNKESISVLTLANVF